MNPKLVTALLLFIVLFGGSYAQDSTNHYVLSDAVTIASQEWLGKNLDVDHFANGEVIPEARSVEEWKAASDNKQPAWCYYDNDPSNGMKYGKLYNWYAVHDPRGLAPRGWHVPSDSEWDVIVRNLAGDGTELNKPVIVGGAKTVTYYETENVGTLLKSKNGWEDFNGMNGNGNNKSGIAGLPGGYRYAFGPFNYVGKYSYWWSASEGNKERAWCRYLSSGNGKTYRGEGGKGWGFSVRCVRD